MELTLVPHLPKSRRLPSILRLDLSHPIFFTMMFSVYWKMQLITTGSFPFGSYMNFSLLSVTPRGTYPLLPHSHLGATWNWGTCGWEWHFAALKGENFIPLGIKLPLMDKLQQV